MNLGGLFAALGRAFPGYVEGQRKAIEDNWRDLEKFNSVQAGQINNAYNEGTFGYAMDNAMMNRDNNVLAHVGDKMDTVGRLIRHPGQMAKDAAETNMLLNGGADDYADMMQKMYRNPQMGMPGAPGASQDPLYAAMQQLILQQQQQRQAAAAAATAAAGAAPKTTGG